MSYGNQGNDQISADLSSSFGSNGGIGSNLFNDDENENKGHEQYVPIVIAAVAVVFLVVLLAKGKR